MTGPEPDGTVDLIPADEVARYLQCSTYSVHRWRRQGRIPPPIVQIGRRLFWDRNVIRAWLRRQAPKGDR